MRCTNCSNCAKDNDIAQIPLIAHEHRIYLADKRETRLKLLLISTNALWLLGLVTYFLVRYL